MSKLKVHDLPLARVVAEYRHQLPKFFKRYQIQPGMRLCRFGVRQVSDLPESLRLFLGLRPALTVIDR
ncbi:MAG: hypothetical protein M3R52_00085 [Acidobacteriota bacterium]|nr:hypothetical protein [Acidobacteriota bacterium]